MIIDDVFCINYIIRCFIFVQNRNMTKVITL